MWIVDVVRLLDFCLKIKCHIACVIFIWHCVRDAIFCFDAGARRQLSGNIKFTHIIC